MKRILWAPILALLACASALAATPTNASTFFVARAFGVGNKPDCIAVGDFNGDGKLDIVTGDVDDAAVAVLLGQGNGTFGPARNFLVDSAPVAIVAADFNGDGRLDLAVATNADVFILLGNGDGTFRTGGAYAASSFPNFMAVGDVNGDGKLDIVFASDNSLQVGEILGNGDGTFGSVKTIAAGAVGPVALGDFTGNGKLDMVVANDGANGNSASLFTSLGNGDGTFGTPKPSPSFEIDFSPTSLALGDFNHDGHLDVAIGNSGTSNAAFEQVLVALGDGTGHLGSYRYFTTGGVPASLVAADVNGDGNLDLVVGNTYDADVTVLLGNGKGFFTASANYAAGSGLIRIYLSVAVGDFNGDGKTDIAVANPGSNNVSVLLAKGSGGFADARDFRVTPPSLYEVAGDFNHDGKQDLVVSGNGTSILFGKGNGTFKAPVTITTKLWGAVIAADLNGDGFLDLIMIPQNSSSQITVLLNNGDGTFGTPLSYFCGDSPTTLAVGDFNGDGKIDVAVTIKSFVSILLGNGDGTLQSPLPFSAGTQPAGIAVGDFNGDGKLDVAVGDSSANDVAVAFGNGDGTLKPAEIIPLPAGNAVQMVAAGDFNGDGHLDLAAFAPGQGTSTVFILLNKGNGTFKSLTAYTVGPVENGSTSMAVADYNLDGHPDIALAAGGSNATVLFNTGNGTFTVNTFGTGGGTPLGSGQFFPVNVVTADFNGDNKPDLAVADGNDGFTILLNQTK
jgi:FG-GAP-like repeat